MKENRTDLLGCDSGTVAVYQNGQQFFGLFAFEGQTFSVVQCFKIARLLLWPMGHTVTTHFSAHPIANLIWIVLFGWEMCVGYVVSGAIYCITVVGIPFGLQCFKLAELSLCPFGASVQ